jgi:hypothetical protein
VQRDETGGIAASIELIQRMGGTPDCRIAMMRALHRQRPKATPAPRRKRAKAYRVVL